MHSMGEGDREAVEGALTTRWPHLCHAFDMSLTFAVSGTDAPSTASRSPSPAFGGGGKRESFMVGYPQLE